MHQDSSQGDFSLRQSLDTLTPGSRFDDALNCEQPESGDRDLAYRLAAEAAGIGTWNMEVESRIVTLCPIFCRLAGFDEEYKRLSHEAWIALIAPEDVPGVEKALAETIETGQPFNLEHRLHLSHGNVLWLLTRGTVILTTEGKPARIIGASLDVTARKRAEEAARASEERYRQLADTSPDGILVKDNGNYVFANPAAARIFGAETAASLMGRSSANFFDAATAEIIQKRIAQVLERGESGHPVTLLSKRLDGSSAYVEIIPARIRWEGRPAVQIIMRDVTEKKHTQDKLRVMNERLKLAVEGTGEGIWDWDIAGDTYTVSGKLKEIFGWQPTEGIGGRIEWSKVIHPHDFERVRHALRTCLTGEKPIYESEFRLATRSGEWKWVLSRGVVVAWDERGRPIAMAGTTSDITARKESDELVWRHANLDELTGLPNRRLFRDRLEAEMRKVQRSGNQLALLFIDLDGFKQVNDLHGHDAGDMLLMEAGNRIQGCVRETDVVARLGGDEFTVVLTGLDSLDHVEFVCQKILTSLASPFFLGNEAGYVSGSIGVAVSPIDAATADELMRKADQAMYAAKDAGKNRFSYFTQEMDERAHARLHLSNELRKALENRQLTLHYQPVVDLSTGQMVKAEALLRWRHPVLGNIEPASFVPIAEECGLIGMIGNWVFREAAGCSQRCSERVGRLVPIGINKSPLQFMSQDEDSDWLQYLERRGMPKSSIVVEITEGLLLHPSPMVNETLLEYANSGVLVAIDDFGTGYSSMSYLHQFHIDYLKIDQSFVQDLETNPSHRTIAETIIIMAHKLGLKVIAEGIESRRQMEFLVDAGCDYGQGYYFSRPVPEAQLVQMLGERFLM
jgi:diguanylate cyclase (GGDEF)-like protein/PAS domain S-box-containing protein